MQEGALNKNPHERKNKMQSTWWKDVKGHHHLIEVARINSG